MSLVESQNIGLVETHDIGLVETHDIGSVEIKKPCVSEWTNFKTHFQKLAPLKFLSILKNLGVLGVILEAWRQPGAPKSSPETPREHTRAPSRPPGSLPEAALSERTPILGSPKVIFRNYVNFWASFLLRSAFC